MTRENTRTFQRALYGPGILETITLLKRNDDQREGTVSAHVVYDCRHSPIFKHGQPIHGEQSTQHFVVWHIPDIELDRVGVNYINVLDRIVDKEGRTWQPESPQSIINKLMENHVCVSCILLQGRSLHG